MTCQRRRLFPQVRQHGLAHARDVLEQDVPAGQQRRHHQVHGLPLTDDDPLDVGDEVGDFRSGFQCR